MQQVQVNKWIRFALSLGTAVLGFLISQLTVIDWTQYMSTQSAGYMVLAIGVVKMIYNSIAPSSDKSTIPTGGKVITQVAKEVPPKDRPHAPAAS